MIYKTFDNNNARTILGNIGSNNLITIGVNPSHATDIISDRTIIKVKRFSNKHDFDGWLMLNIYTQRATKLNYLHDNFILTYHDENLKQIKNHLQIVKSGKIWCAWGESILERPYLIELLKDIYIVLRQFDFEMINIGELTKTGHPRHPSRLAYNNELKIFDIETYIKNIAHNIR